MILTSCKKQCKQDTSQCPILIYSDIKAQNDKLENGGKSSRRWRQR